MKLNWAQNHDGSSTLMVEVERSDFMEMLPDLIVRAVVERVSAEIAAKFTEEHAQEILAALDPQAIANLAIAGGAAAVNKTLREKLPDKVVEVVREKTQVFQRGIFGGLRRIR